jgi:hypothetical protein
VAEDLLSLLAGHLGNSIVYDFFMDVVFNQVCCMLSATSGGAK